MNSLYLKYVTQDCASDGREKYFFCVWNPATHEYKKILQPTKKVDSKDTMMYAFGHDRKTNEYKLVFGAKSTDRSSEVQIYTLGRNCWKGVVSVPYSFFSYRKSGVLVNESFHWLASKEMQLSTKLKEPKNNPLFFITEAVLEECLFILRVFTVNEHRADNDPAHIEVWVMQNYGVRESWTKRYVITHEIITRNIAMRCPIYFKFIFSSKNGQILLAKQGKLVLYDPKHGSAIEREMGSVLRFSSEENYYESLVSVNSGTYARKGEIEESIEAKEA